MATQQEVIKNFMNALDNTTLSGAEAVDAAIQACSNFSSTQAVIDQLISDCQSSDSGDEFLRNYCGIILGNEDTGAITGSDAGGTLKTAESVIPEGDSLINFTGNEFTTNGATFTLENGFDNLNDDEKFIWQALYTWWAEECLELIEDSYGYSLSDSDATVTDIPVEFVYDDSTTWIAWSSYHDYAPADGKMDAMSLTVNMDAFGGIDKDDYNGVGSGTKFYLDRTLAHEFTHLVMYGKVDYEYDLPIFIDEGLAELVHGIDDERDDELAYLAENPSVLSSWMNTSTEGSGGHGTDYSYEAGYIFLHYLAKQASSADSASTSYYVYTGGNQTISNYAGEKIFIGMLPTGLNFIGDDFHFYSETGELIVEDVMDKIIDFRDGWGNEFAKAYAATNPGVIDARNVAGFGYIVGSDAGTDIIYAGNESSKLWGNTGNYDDALIGGAGEDTFFTGKYEGNDVIFDAAAQDNINLYDVSLSDIVATSENNGTLAFAFNTGNTVIIQSTETLSAKINLADGLSFRFNHANKSFQF